MKFSSLFFIVTIIVETSCNTSGNCVDGINKMPMYGGIKKCSEQIEADKAFIAISDSTYKGRKNATAHLLMRGWQYFYAKKADTAIMRFNEAWLLDSLNSEAYWGMGNSLGMQRRFKESLPLFRKSLKIDSSNAKVWEDMSLSYGNIFFETKDKTYLDSSIYFTKKAMKIDPKNPHFYSEITSAYSYFIQKDSAKKYLKIADQIDPNVINPEVRKYLSNN